MPKNINSVTITITLEDTEKNKDFKTTTMTRRQAETDQRPFTC